jgi:hypothetical protein
MLLIGYLALGIIFTVLQWAFLLRQSEHPLSHRKILVIVDLAVYVVAVIFTLAMGVNTLST